MTGQDRGPGPAASPDRGGHGHDGTRLRGHRGGGGHREPSMVPDADFRSYYGRPVLKPPVWEWKIPAYLFTGGLAAGSAVLGAGADLTDRPALRRGTRLGALGALLASVVLLVTDLGRPERFHHMLRVAKPTSPMSVGTWILTAFGPGAGVAAVSELMPARVRRTALGRLTDRLARPAGLSAAAFAPGVASYTAVLLAHTAVPAWHEARNELPWVFTGSAAAASGGLAMAVTPVDEAAPARWFAAAGAVGELTASTVLEHRLGPVIREAYSAGRPFRLRAWSGRLTAAGLAGTLLGGHRSRGVAAASGLALMAGSALQRFGVFAAGVESTRDPRYVVVPQRERLERQRSPVQPSAQAGIRRPDSGSPPP